MGERLPRAGSGLFLELYRGARELGVAEFPGFVFGLVTAALRFDASAVVPVFFTWTMVL